MTGNDLHDFSRPLTRVNLIISHSCKVVAAAVAAAAALEAAQRRRASELGCGLRAIPVQQVAAPRPPARPIDTQRLESICAQVARAKRCQVASRLRALTWRRHPRG